MINSARIQALRLALTKLQEAKRVGASPLEIGAQHESLGKLFADVGLEVLDMFCEAQKYPIRDLQSQLTALDELISQTPAEDVIDRKSLEARKREVTKELETLRGAV
jgi:hypothetical protein